jgi:hypothetical protein
VEEVNRTFKDSGRTPFYYVAQAKDELDIKEIIASHDKTLFSATGGGFESNALSEIRKPPAPFTSTEQFSRTYRPDLRSGSGKPTHYTYSGGSSSSYQRRW